jgi:hypothetical protein
MFFFFAYSLRCWRALVVIQVTELILKVTNFYIIIIYNMSVSILLLIVVPRYLYCHEFMAA